MLEVDAFVSALRPAVQQVPTLLAPAAAFDPARGTRLKSSVHTVDAYAPAYACSLVNAKSS